MRGGYQLLPGTATQPDVSGRDGHDNNSPFYMVSNQRDPTIRDSLAPYDAGYLE